MEITRNLKVFLKPILTGTSFIIVVSLLFIAVGIFVEYRQYLQTYQKEQQAELAVVQQNTQKISTKLRELLQLTGKRIEASHGDSNRIQNILNSAPRLYEPYELPKIQSLSYYKVSHPQMMITRLGILPLDQQHLPPALMIEPTPLVSFHEDVIKSKVSVLNYQGIIEGVLEIVIDPADFKAVLGNFQTLLLTVLPSSHYKEPRLLQRTPFVLYSKNLDTFWEFVCLSKSRYAVFFLYSLFLLVILIPCVFYIHLNMKRDFGDIVKKLRINLEKLTLAAEQAHERAALYEQKYKNHRTSYETHRKIQEALNIRQREHILQVQRFLTSIAQTNSQLSPERHRDIMESCLQSTHLLSTGLITKTKFEPIKLHTLLQEIRSLLTEKIYKANITLDCLCSDQLVLYGDSLFTEIILLNVIGKALYRVSRNGKVSIKVTSQGQVICFHLQDQGFPPTHDVEHHMKRLFDFVISEELLQRMCQEAGMRYTSSRTEEGFNVHELLISTFLEESSDSNVISLFS